MVTMRHDIQPHETKSPCLSYQTRRTLRSQFNRGRAQSLGVKLTSALGILQWQVIGVTQGTTQIQTAHVYCGYMLSNRNCCCWPCNAPHQSTLRLGFGCTAAISLVAEFAQPQPYLHGRSALQPNLHKDGSFMQSFQQIQSTYTAPVL